MEHRPQAVAALVERIAGLEPDPAEVRVVIETRHGLLVEALVEAGYTVLPVNPELASRRRGPARARALQRPLHIHACNRQGDDTGGDHSPACVTRCFPVAQSEVPLVRLESEYRELVSPPQPTPAIGDRASRNLSPWTIALQLSSCNAT